MRNPLNKGIPFKQFLEQSKVAEKDHHLFIDTLTKLQVNYPRVKMIKIHDSWTFEGDLNQCQSLLKEVEKEVKRRR